MRRTVSNILSFQSTKQFWITGLWVLVIVFSLPAGVLAMKGDFNGDGKGDLVWRNQSTGAVAIWLMNGKAIQSSGFLGVPLEWTMQGTGDVDNDGKEDIIWRHTSGTVAIWRMNGLAIAGVGFPGKVSAGWLLKGVADVDGDGKANFIWRNQESGIVAVWIMDGTTLVSSGFLGGVPREWMLAGTGDVNGDGKSDILWRNQLNGLVAIWLMDGITIMSLGFPGTAPIGWVVQGSDDLDGNGTADILWRNMVDGKVAVWLMNGTSIAESEFLDGPPFEWQVVANRDVDGDGKGDVIWRNAKSGVVAEWLMDGKTVKSIEFPGSTSLDFVSAIPGDNVRCEETTEVTLIEDGVVSWINTFEYAGTLGYSETNSLQLCKEQVTGKIVVTGILSNPQQADHNNGLVLYSSESDNVAFLGRIGPNGKVNIFNEGGGIEFDSSDLVKLLDQVGVSNDAKKMRKVGAATQIANCGEYWGYVACEIGKSNVTGKLCFAAIFACLKYARSGEAIRNCVGALGLACGEYLMGFATGPSDSCAGFSNTNDKPCDSQDFCSSSAKCFVGVCWPVESGAKEGKQCSVQAGLPICRGPSTILENKVCKKGYCVSSVVPCPEGQKCTGNSGDVKCSDGSCGNEVVDHGEECDPPGGPETAKCNADCSRSRCGDEIINKKAGEACDGSNLDNQDCLSLTGIAGGTLTCSGSCGFDSSKCLGATCGDGNVDKPIDGPNEQCDDGNDDNTDGCLNNCRFPFCGDGYLHQDPSREECDDGNKVSGDGCDSNCKRDDGGICGDGTVQPPYEKCDDGNRNNGDGCDRNCQPEGEGEDGGDSWGDPHLTTFDRLAYDFQAVGEFSLVKSLDDSLEIQTRTKPWRNFRFVSINTAVSMNISGDTVGIYVDRDPVLYINGVATILENGLVSLTHGGKIASNEDVFTITWPDNSQVRVQYRKNINLNVRIKLASLRKGRVAGLLGNFDGVRENDISARDGVSFSTRPTFNELYEQYGESWRISQEESLFDYVDGNTTDTHTDRSVPRGFFTTSNLTPSVRQQAAQICLAEGITDPVLLEGCILDVGVTGDETFAEFPANIVPPEDVLNPTNQVPIVTAGPDQWITLPSTANLTGTVSDDGLPSPPGTLSILWTQVSGPATVTFADASNLATTASFSTPGSYVLRLIADDSELITVDEMTITVIPENAVGTVAFGESRSGTINPATEIDVYKFTGKAGDEVVVPWSATAAFSFRLLMELYDAAGTLVASNTTGAASGTLRASLSNSGDYFLWVKESDGAATISGNYSFSLQRTVNPGNVLGTIAYGESRSGTISPVTEIDVYKFTAQAGDEIEVPWSATAAFSFRLLMELYDAAGTLVASNTTGTASGTLSASLSNSGDYFLWVRESDRVATMAINYSFSLQRTVNPGNVLGTIAYGESRSGTISPVTEIDVYKFTAQAGDEIEVPWSATAAFSFRLLMELYDAAGTLVASNTSGTASGTLSASFNNGGDYFLWVRESDHFASTTGSYSFTLNLIQPSP